VVVEPTVACNEVDCGSILTLVSSVCYESGFEVTDDFGLFVAKIHLGAFGSITFPFILIKLENFVVNLLLDLGVWYRAVEDGVT
jgi:hypothetical protein